MKLNLELMWSFLQIFAAFSFWKIRYLSLFNMMLNCMYWGFALFVRQTGILEDTEKVAACKNALSLKSECVIPTTDESIYSSQSSESCEYYQTEIYDQLPSVQASRSGQSTGLWEGTLQGGQEPEGNTSHGRLSRRPRDKESTLPLRNLAICMQGKRGARSSLVSLF